MEYAVIKQINMKIILFWDVMPRSPLQINQCGVGGGGETNTTSTCMERVRLRPACQQPACTHFHEHAGDWCICVLCDSDRLVAKWRH
jgi:hypothetical protein